MCIKSLQKKKHITNFSGFFFTPFFHSFSWFELFHIIQLFFRNNFFLSFSWSISLFLIFFMTVNFSTFCIFWNNNNTLAFWTPTFFFFFGFKKFSLNKLQFYEIHGDKNWFISSSKFSSLTITVHTHTKSL